MKRTGFFSPAPWAATLYLLSFPVLGTVFFGLTLVLVLVSWSLSIVVFGIPLLVVAAVIVRGCAEIERWRARLVADPIPSGYRTVSRPGLLAQVKTRWSDPATLRDCGYLILMYVPLLVFDIVVVSLWLAFLGMVTLPFWYWSIPQQWDDGTIGHGVSLGYVPNPPRALFDHGGFGLWVGDLPTAVGVAVVFFLLALLASRVVVGAARLHAKLARSLLGPSVDPLWEAKRVLAEPGPLAATERRTDRVSQPPSAPHREGA